MLQMLLKSSHNDKQIIYNNNKSLCVCLIQFHQQTQKAHTSQARNLYNRDLTAGWRIHRQYDFTIPAWTQTIVCVCVSTVCASINIIVAVVCLESPRGLPCEQSNTIILQHNTYLTYFTSTHIPH